MDYQIKKLPKSEIQITVNLTAEDIVPHEKKAYEEISKELNIKGFRPGHIPQEVIDQHVDKKHITARAKELSIQKSYADAVIKENLQVISRPRVEIKSEEPFSYVATVAVLPEIKLKDHKSIKIKKEEQKATEKDIEDTINDMKKYATTYKDIDTESKKGHRVEADFEGFDEEGKALENTASKNHPIILGEGTMVPGFEEALIGMKKGESKEFEITFPKDYGKKDFQNKKVKFKVEIKRVEESISPEIDDAFIEKMTGQKQTVEDFKKDLSKNIAAQKEQNHQRERENQYIEEVLKRLDVDVPDSLIDEEVEYIIHDMEHDMQHRGIPFEKFLQSAKTTIEDLKKKYRPEAEKRIKIRLALQHLIKEEKIDVTDAEMEKELAVIKAAYPESEGAKIDEDFHKGGLKNQLLNRIALRKLFAQVLN